MRKIIITEEQLNKTLNIDVDVENNDIEDSIKQAKKDSDSSAGPGVERNYVISDESINENTNNRVNEYNDAINQFWEEFHKNEEMQEECLSSDGKFKETPVMEYLLDIVVNAVNEESYKELLNLFSKSIMTNESTSRVFTKKELKECILKNKLKGAKVFTKSQLK